MCEQSAAVHAPSITQAVLASTLKVPPVNMPASKEPNLAHLGVTVPLPSQ
jgi:hypothetical protein